MQAQVVGDPERATPAPLEEVDLTINVIETGAASERQWLFIVCVPVPNVLDAPICVDGTVISTTPECEDCTNETGTTMDPSLRITIPSEAILGDAEAMLLVGVVCAGGATVSIEDLTAITTGEADTVSPCMDESNDGEFIVTEIPLQVGSTTNNNPTIGNVNFNNAVPLWTDMAPDDAPATGCGAPGLMVLTAGAPPFAISVTVDASSFEDFTIMSDGPDNGDTATEQLLVSWHTTAGQLDRSFTFLDTKDELIARNVWIPPLEAPSDGTLVRFTMVLRDRDERGASRGGMAWVERAVCIVPSLAVNDE